MMLKQVRRIAAQQQEQETIYDANYFQMIVDGHISQNKWGRDRCDHQRDLGYGASPVAGKASVQLNNGLPESFVVAQFRHLWLDFLDH
jgi:hypothetical protein